jgi:hypothetical protein
MQPVLPVKAESLQAGLNPEQAAAVVHTSGPLLILAGAGTGKTRVITHRIASLVMRGLAAPREVLALTFTNKAAAEMRDRTQVLIGHDAKFATISTFHSACARWLREYARYAELKPSFSIYDDEDQLSLVRVVAEAMNIPHDAAAARSYRQRIEQANNEAMRTVEVQSRARGRDGELFAELYTAYQAALIQANAVDFGSLVSTMVHLLEDNEEIRSQFRRRYRHVLVDEFQDTNRAQYRLLRQLAGDDSQIAAVGDDDQSIFRFQGASVDNMLRFLQKYPKATEKDWVEKCFLKSKDIQAERLLNIATFYKRIGRSEPAERYLTDVLKKYPDSLAAENSEEMLTKLDKTYVPEGFRPEVESRFQSSIGKRHLWDSFYRIHNSPLNWHCDGGQKWADRFGFHQNDSRTSNYILTKYTNLYWRISRKYHRHMHLPFQ